LRLADFGNGLRGLADADAAVERLRRDMLSFFGVEFCFFVSSGKTALTLILQALHSLRPERDEVLIPAFSCYSVPSAVLRAGLRIRLCDVNPDTLDYDERDLSQVDSINGWDDGTRSSNGRGNRSSRLLAVVAVHPFGMPADLTRVQAATSQSRAFVIEDAAQAMGARTAAGMVGAQADVGFFSLGRGKSLSCVEGGVIVTRDRNIASKITERMAGLGRNGAWAQAVVVAKAIALLGMQHPTCFWIPKLIPFLKIGDTLFEPDFPLSLLSGFQAGLGRHWNEKLADFSAMRRRASAYWYQRVQRKELHLFRKTGEGVPSFLRFPVRVDDAELYSKILQESDRLGLGIMITYPKAICDVEEIWGCRDSSGFSGARRLARSLLTLPVHPYLTQQDMRRIDGTLHAL
jgi:dTDP-4-amino-4,6-dideoxygalactose transaminase